MLTLPDSIVAVLPPFATLFQQRTWIKAQVLLASAILSPGQRTVASALRVMGRFVDRNCARHHHVLNRAIWPPPQVLLRLLLQHLALRLPSGGAKDPWCSASTRPWNSPPNRSPVPLRRAARAGALGPGPGSPRRTGHPGSPMHQPGGGSGADRGMVRAALATGGDFPWGAVPLVGAALPGNGNPAPVV